MPYSSYSAAITAQLATPRLEELIQNYGIAKWNDFYQVDWTVDRWLEQPRVAGIMCCWADPDADPISSWNAYTGPAKSWDMKSFQMNASKVVGVEAEVMKRLSEGQSPERLKEELVIRQRTLCFGLAIGLRDIEDQLNKFYTSCHHSLETDLDIHPTFVTKDFLYYTIEIRNDLWEMGL